MGPLSSPRERGPDFNLVFPRYPVPEVGADNSYNDLWLFEGRLRV